MKLIEQHTHFDGAADLQLAEQLAGPSARNKMVCNGNGNLAQYLTNFDLPIKLMQTKENLSHFAHLMAEQLLQDGVIYAEVRFCPLFHTQAGLTMGEVITAVIDGFAKVPEVKVNLILCMMRNLSLESNMSIIDIAGKFLRKGVVALDLAGDEAARPNTDPEFGELFRRARIDGIPFTIHAGEAAGPESIEAAIDLGASRIGHGVRAIESKNTLKMLADRWIPLEVCVSSNVHTGV